MADYMSPKMLMLIVNTTSIFISIIAICLLLLCDLRSTAPGKFLSTYMPDSVFNTSLKYRLFSMFYVYDATEILFDNNVPLSDRRKIYALNAWLILPYVNLFLAGSWIIGLLKIKRMLRVFLLVLLFAFIYLEWLLLQSLFPV